MQEEIKSRNEIKKWHEVNKLKKILVGFSSSLDLWNALSHLNPHMNFSLQKTRQKRQLGKKARSDEVRNHKGHISKSTKTKSIKNYLFDFLHYGSSKYVAMSVWIHTQLSPLQQDTAKRQGR